MASKEYERTQFLVRGDLVYKLKMRLFRLGEISPEIDGHIMIDIDQVRRLIDGVLRDSASMTADEVREYEIERIGGIF